MVDLSTSAKEALIKIYIGQHINQEGILQSESDSNCCYNELLFDGLIRSGQWYRFHVLLTTNKGSELARELIIKIIESTADEIRGEFKQIPSKILGFFVIRFVSRKLIFNTEKPYLFESWEERILSDSRLWILWNKFFTTLQSKGLCVRAHDYVSTKGGELRDHYYVITPEVQEYLRKNYSLSDFTSSQEESLILFPVLFTIDQVISSDNLDFLRQKYYELLTTYSVAEGQIAGLINRMNQQGITSEYRGLLSDQKPFDIIDSTRFHVFIDKNIVEPAIDYLFDKRGLIKQYSVDARIPSLLEVKEERGFLDSKELGEFYIIVSNLERDLREFIKAKIGKGWNKRIENELINVYEHWQEKLKKDESWGIEPEEELINYADVEDYIEIIKKYNRLFVSAERQLSNVITYLEIWYKYGRNPLMHCRTVSRQKYETTKSAIGFIKKWMAEKSSI